MKIEFENKATSSQSN